MESIIDMWRDRKPIAVIAETHNVKRREVIELLGDEYSKNEAHYRANEYRDAKRLGAFADWFTNSFDLAELQQAINDGQLQAYWAKIAEPEKLTVPAVRDYVTAQLGELPARTTSRSKYDPDNYRLGKKSRYFGREQELIDMWQKDGLSIDGIYSKTGVSKLSLKKLLMPIGYKTPVITKATTTTKKPAKAKLTVTKKPAKPLTPLAIKRRENDKKKPEIASTIMSTWLTNHEIARQFDVSDRVVAKIAKNLGVDMSLRTQDSQVRRGKKISASLKTSTKSREVRERLQHRHMMFEPTFLGDTPAWVWTFIEKQDAVTIDEKIRQLLTEKEQTLALLAEAERQLNRKVNVSELNDLIPKQRGLLSPAKMIYQAYANDSDIATLTNGLSQHELRISRILDEMNVKYRTRDRSLGFELDFYLPDSNLAIEASPLATHNSNQYKNFGLTSAQAKPNNYHYDKYKICAENGITLITLFEKQLEPEVWTLKTLPMLRRLVTGRANLTLYARQTTIKLMTKPDDKKRVDGFLERYHMDGKTPANIRYAMYYNDNIVAVATFAIPTTPKYKDGQTIELKRLAFRADAQVRYGVSKFVAHVHADFPVYSRLMTYSNNNMGHGNGYAKSGFDFVSETGVQLTFVNPLNPTDTYSWSVATKWGAKSGVIARLIGSQDIDSARAREIVETTLPHRTDDKTGYVAQYDSGNKLWLKTF